jgi:hypothetical protein
MATDPEILYRQLGRLIEAMPDLTQFPVSNDVHLWVGRAYALVQEVGNLADPAIFTVTANNLGTTGRIQAAKEIKNIVYRAFAVAEMKAPAGASGAFIPVGDSFDAFAALSKVLQTATKDVLIIDPFMDETALTEFGSAVPETVRLRLMADQASCKPTLQPAANKWIQQYGGTRPLLVRLAPPKSLHDRAIFIDQTTAWTLTQSLKDFAKRSPAEIVRADDTAALKITAYEGIWDSAQIIV